ncbi:MAG: PQQ-binding-like beta-propeller repeat protein [Pirellulales bacterium]
MIDRPGLWSWSSVLLLALSTGVGAQEWTRFRGPNGTGLSDATTIPTRWTEKDFNWKVELPGVGHSSPVLWGDRIFLTSAFEDTATRIVLCLDAADGKILWQRQFRFTLHGKHKFNSFASSTPAVDEERVYLTWSAPEEYTLLALDHEGNDVWYADLGPFVGDHSGGTSPMVYEDLVVLGGDQGLSNGPPDADSFLVAVDRRTGQRRWQTGRRTENAAYSTPCVYQPDGQPAQLIFNSGAHGISGIDPRTGETMWELDVLDKRSVSSPIVTAGLVFGTTGSGGGGHYLAAVRPPAPGSDGKPELVYGVPDLAPYVPTLIAKDGLVFLWHDKGKVTCLRAATGDELWSERVGGNFSGSPVIAGDRLYAIAENGTVVVLAAGEKFELLGRNPLGEDSRSTPAVAGGRMYLRTLSHLISVGGK